MKKNSLNLITEVSSLFVACISTFIAYEAKKVSDESMHIANASMNIANDAAQLAQNDYFISVMPLLVDSGIYNYRNVGNGVAVVPLNDGLTTYEYLWLKPGEETPKSSIVQSGLEEEEEAYILYNDIFGNTVKTYYRRDTYKVYRYWHSGLKNINEFMKHGVTSSSPMYDEEINYKIQNNN